MVFVTGVIMPGESRNDNLQGKIAGSESIIEDLQAAADDESIDAVILRVDSPGGSALASDLIWHEIVELRKEKPVIVSMSGLAASGGYYVSCLGDSIFADTGHADRFDRRLRRQDEPPGDVPEDRRQPRVRHARRERPPVQRRGRLHRCAARRCSRRRWTGSTSASWPRSAEGRGLTRDQVHEVAQGRVWTGRQGVRARAGGRPGRARPQPGRGQAPAGRRPRSQGDRADLRRADVVRREDAAALPARGRHDAAGGAAGRGRRRGGSGTGRRGAWTCWPAGWRATLRDDGTLAAAAMLDGRRAGADADVHPGPLSRDGAEPRASRALATTGLVR